MSDLTIQTLIDAMEKCWSYGESPKWLPVGFWQWMQMEEIDRTGDCRRTLTMFKAVKKTEVDLAKIYGRQYSPPR